MLQEITDEDLQAGNLKRYREIAEFIGFTLLSSAGFIVIGLCFARDPVGFIFAFGTGCPCCIVLCPCIRRFTDKYLNIDKLVQGAMNTYMPGIVMKQDGSLDFYEPTMEEITILMEIIDELMP